MDLEGEAGRDILGIKNGTYTKAEWPRSVKGQGVLGERLRAHCGAHQMDRMGSSVCEGWGGRPAMGCDDFSVGFSIFQEDFKDKSFTVNLQIMSYLRYCFLYFSFYGRN